MDLSSMVHLEYGSWPYSILDTLTELTTATQCSVVHTAAVIRRLQKWHSTPPLVSLLVLVNMSTPHRSFVTSSIGCQCLTGYSSKLLDWLVTESEAPGLPTSVLALPAQSLTIQAVLVSDRPRVAICSFHELEQLGSEDVASSSQLQLSGTHCRFTFAPRPSVAVSFEQGSRLKLIFSGWPFTTDLSSENYWTDWTNGTENPTSLAAFSFSFSQNRQPKKHRLPTWDPIWGQHIDLPQSKTRQSRRTIQDHPSRRYILTVCFSVLHQATGIKY